MKLIVGLGNPERIYANTRHNIGFMCVNHFAKKHGIEFDKKQANARTGEGEIDGERVILARPQTHMNLSGESVRRLVEKHHVDPADLIVIHDDLDLPLGKIRIRQGGSAGGHKGIKSIINHLGTGDFIRIKIGIGRPEAARDKEECVIDHVLSSFNSGERKIISETIPRVTEAVSCLLKEGLTAAMNEFN